MKNALKLVTLRQVRIYEHGTSRPLSTKLVSYRRARRAVARLRRSGADAYSVPFQAWTTPAQRQRAA